MYLCLSMDNVILFVLQADFLSTITVISYLSIVSASPMFFTAVLAKPDTDWFKVSADLAVDPILISHVSPALLTILSTRMVSASESARTVTESIKQQDYAWAVFREWRLSMVFVVKQVKMFRMEFVLHHQILAKEVRWILLHITGTAKYIVLLWVVVWNVWVAEVSCPTVIVANEIYFYYFH